MASSIFVRGKIVELFLYFDFFSMEGTEDVYGYLYCYDRIQAEKITLEAGTSSWKKERINNTSKKFFILKVLKTNLDV